MWQVVVQKMFYDDFRLSTLKNRRSLANSGCNIIVARPHIQLRHSSHSACLSADRWFKTCNSYESTTLNFRNKKKKKACGVRCIRREQDKSFLHLWQAVRIWNSTRYRTLLRWQQNWSGRMYEKGSEQNE